MGKGDKKSRRGKLFAGTFGKRRKRKKSNAFAPPVTPEPKKKVAEVKESKPVPVAAEAKTAEKAVVEEKKAAKAPAKPKAAKKPAAKKEAKPAAKKEAKPAAKKEEKKDTKNKE